MRLWVLPLWTAVGLALSVLPGRASAVLTFDADVFFGTYSSQVSSVGQAKVADAIQKAITTRRKYALEFCATVVGHADQLEAGVMNAIELALARANAVATLLKADGYPFIRLEVESKGASQPIVSAPDVRNSRVELELYSCQRR